MPDLLPGTIVLAADTPVTVSAQQGTSFDATTTTYDVTSTAGGYADCAVVFVAPTSGRVIIHTSARMINSVSTSGTLVAPETRTGGTVGSGTVVESATDNSGASHYGSTFARSGAAHLLTGLTPGATYNTRLLHRASANTATIALRELIVQGVS